jgi:hypothetical protein
MPLAHWLLKRTGWEWATAFSRSKKLGDFAIEKCSGKSRHLQRAFHISFGVSVSCPVKVLV